MAMIFNIPLPTIGRVHVYTVNHSTYLFMCSTALLCTQFSFRVS